VPHPTTLVKLVRRAGPEVIAQLNAALLDKLAQDKLLRGRKLRVDTTVVEASIDYPTDADLLEQAVRKVGGLVRRINALLGAARGGSGQAGQQIPGAHRWQAGGVGGGHYQPMGPVRTPAARAARRQPTRSGCGRHGSGG
jgi:hypothetical protein